MAKVRKTESGREYRDEPYKDGAVRIIYPKPLTTQSYIAMAMRGEDILGSVSIQGEGRTSDIKTDKLFDSFDEAVSRCKKLIDLFGDAIQQIQTQEV